MIWDFCRRLVQPVRAEPWACMLQDLSDLEFLGMWTGDMIEFCFLSGKEIFSVRIPQRSPFNIIDESYLGTLHRSLKGKSRTWKTFGTPFVRALQKTILLHFEPAHSRFSYLIVTGDECVEFISPEPEIRRMTPDELTQKLEQLPRYFSDRLG